MRALRRPLAILVAVGVSAAAVAALQEKGGQEEFGPYELVENWPQPPTPTSSRRASRRRLHQATPAASSRRARTGRILLARPFPERREVLR